MRRKNLAVYHVDSIEYLITNTYTEAKGWLYHLLGYGWKKTDNNDYAYFHLSNKDVDIINIKIQYYYAFVKGSDK